MLQHNGRMDIKMKKIYKEIGENKVRELIQDGVVNDVVRLAFRNSEEEDWRQHDLWYVVLTTAKEPAKKYETEAGSFSQCAIVECNSSENDSKENYNINQYLPDHIYEVVIRRKTSDGNHIEFVRRFWTYEKVSSYINSLPDMEEESISVIKLNIDS